VGLTIPVLFDICEARKTLVVLNDNRRFFCLVFWNHNVYNIDIKKILSATDFSAKRRFYRNSGKAIRKRLRISDLLLWLLGLRKFVAFNYVHVCF